MSLTVTFVVSLNGRLRVSDRRSEHVKCAGGQPVLAAGEMTFVRDDDRIFVERVTNQSTGYCPEPESWQAVANALDLIPVGRPDSIDPAIVFRKCNSCSQINTIKDGEVFDVEAGAIVYVKAGVEHHFHDVIEDLTVLVFFSSKEDGRAANESTTHESRKT